MTDTIPKEDITKDFASNVGKSLDELRRSDERHEQIIGLVIIVLFVGFFLLAAALATIIVDDFRSKETSYTGVVQTLDQQNSILNSIAKKLNLQ